MKLLDHLPQLAPLDAGVADGGVELGVAEQLLDLPKIHPGLLAVGGGRAPERVGRDPNRGVHPIGQVLEPDAHPGLAERDPHLGDEERFRLRVKARPGFGEIPGNPLCRLRPDRDGPLLPALPPNPKLEVLEIDVREGEPARLA
jgi:hypothetical protein